MRCVSKYGVAGHTGKAAQSWLKSPMPRLDWEATGMFMLWYEYGSASIVVGGSGG